MEFVVYREAQVQDSDESFGPPDSVGPPLVHTQTHATSEARTVGPLRLQSTETQSDRNATIKNIARCSHVTFTKLDLYLPKIGIKCNGILKKAKNVFGMY
jgi:hypothetical protein